MNRICSFILLLLVVTSCSTGEKSLQRGNYYDAIMKAVKRLSSDPENRKSIDVIREGYPLSVAYYQEQIDQFLTSNDPFRWRKTLEMMQAVNGMSEEIRRIPAARKIVPSPKTYTSELADVSSKAAQECYDAGMDALNQNTRETAKQAFFYFRDAEGMVRGFKDTKQKMLQTKDLATLKVIVEQIPVNGKFEYSAQFFYDNVFQMLNQRFQEADFVHFYSPEQAERSKLKFPDMVLQMGFYDFYIDRPARFEEEKELSRDVEEKYEVRDASGAAVTKTRMLPKKGKIKIITDQMGSGGILELKTVDFQTKKIVFVDKIPGKFTWENKYGIFVGDKEVLDANQIKILDNKAITAPESQDMFVLFTKPIFMQLRDKLCNYFKQYN